MSLITLFWMYVGAVFMVNFLWLPLFVVPFFIALYFVEDFDNDSSGPFYLWIGLFVMVVVSSLLLGNPLIWMWNNFNLIVYGAVEYLSIGFIYCVLRWISLSYDEARKISRERENIEKQFASAGKYYKNLEEWLIANHYTSVITHSKYKLFIWIVLWPISAINYFLHDFIRKVNEIIVDLLKNTFYKIRLNIYKRYGIDEAFLLKKNENKE